MAWNSERKYLGRGIVFRSQKEILGYGEEKGRRSKTDREKNILKIKLIVKLDANGEQTCSHG